MGRWFPFGKRRNAKDNNCLFRSNAAGFGRRPFPEAVRQNFLRTESGTAEAQSLDGNGEAIDNPLTKDNAECGSKNHKPLQGQAKNQRPHFHTAASLVVDRGFEPLCRA